MNGWDLTGVYTKKCNDVQIMIVKSDETFDVYYSFPGYAFKFAFGLLLKYKDSMFSIAEHNIEQYRPVLCD